MANIITIAIIIYFLRLHFMHGWVGFTWNLLGTLMLGGIINCIVDNDLSGAFVFLILSLAFYAIAKIRFDSAQKHKARR
jgi:hypothetical protein